MDMGGEIRSGVPLRPVSGRRRAARGAAPGTGSGCLAPPVCPRGGLGPELVPPGGRQGPARSPRACCGAGERAQGGGPGRHHGEPAPLGVWPRRFGER